MLSVKFFLFVVCAIAVAFAMPNDGPLVGGVQRLSGSDLEDAHKTLQNSLNKLAAGDGPVYKISKLNYATSQVVSGRIYKYNVDLIDTTDTVKNCDVDIWSQPWLPNGIQVTFGCNGEEQLVKKHSA